MRGLSGLRMGNRESNESAAVKRQAEGFSNPMYRMLDLGVSLTSLNTIAANPLALQGGGLFLELSKKAMLTGKTSELDEAIRSKVGQEYCHWLMMMTHTLLHQVRPYLYNDGDGKWIHCAHLACLRNR